MIVGVWCRDGVSKAASLLEQLTGVAQRSPSFTTRSKDSLLAAWSLGVCGRIEAAKDVAWLGSPRTETAALTLQNAGRLGGLYALIYGKEEGLLLACSFPAGRSLYVTRLADGVIVACSRLQFLVAVREVLTPDVAALGALTLGHVPKDTSATSFKEIRRVRAGQAILINHEGIISADSNSSVTLHQGSPDELAEELNATIHRVIRRYIEGTRRIAILVSGGLDSSSVLAHAVAVARGASRPEIEAITWSFAGPGDDRPYLRDLCDALGLVPACISSVESSPSVVPMLTADGGPFIWPTAAPIVLLSQRARAHGAERVLTGMGGDQLLNGDPRSFSRMLSAGQWHQAIRVSVGNERVASWKGMKRIAQRLVLPRVGAAIPALSLRRRRRFAEQRWPWAGPRLRRISSDIYLSDFPNREWQSATSETKLKRLVDTDFVHFAMNRSQRESLSSLMQLDPLLDEEVVSLVARFPQQVLLFGDRQRGLFRHAMRGMLPERLRVRRDKGRFEPAIAEMVAFSDRAALEDLAKMRALGDLGLVDPVAFYRRFQAVLAEGGQSLGWVTIWPPLAVEAFVRSQWQTAQARNQ